MSPSGSGATTNTPSLGAAQQTLHQLAADSTAGCFGRQVFVRGVVEVSNFCRENCSYCGMRRDHRALTRFRAQAEGLTAMLLHQRPASLTDLNIQAGEARALLRSQFVGIGLVNAKVLESA